MAAQRSDLAEIGTRTVTLTENAGGHFECRWVHLKVNPNARASFLSAIDDLIFCPVAHGEGNFRVAETQTLSDLENDGLVAFRYVDRTGQLADGEYPINPNGSVADIAGICNEQGNVVGLMPHPEDHIVPVQNPVGMTILQSERYRCMWIEEQKGCQKHHLNFLVFLIH